MIKNGISEDNLRKLFTHAQIGEKEQDMVRNLSQLGINTIADVSYTKTILKSTETSANHLICVFFQLRATERSSIR